MKAFLFIRDIFKKFPALLTVNTLLLVVVSMLDAFSLLTLTPIVDFLIHPDLAGISPFTVKAIGILKFFGLSVTLGNWLLIFITLIVLSSAVDIFARYSILRTVYAVLRDILLGMFEDFFAARWYFFSSSKQGVLLNTFNRELAVVSTAFTKIALFFTSVIELVFFLTVPLCISWQVTSISLAAGLLFVLPFILLSRHTYRLGQLNTSTANQMSAVVQENLGLAKIVLGFANQHKSIANLSAAFNAHRLVTVKSQIINIAIPKLYRPFGVVMIIIALFSARRFGVSLSEITVLLLALLQVAVSIGNITMHKNALDNFAPSYEQIKDLRERAKELKQDSGPRQFKGFVRELIAQGVSFAYPGQEEPVFKDINVRIPKGKMVAFVGESGTGKSTFIDIVMGFHQPTAGRIIIDDIPLKEFDINSYRGRLGYVPQESILFNMSIRDNLRWADEKADEEGLRRACSQANADKFIDELPRGYDTLVGDRGVRLSGGQIQRIALARAILRKPDILILDEATSSLDTYSERLIQQAIEEIARETTVIIIAHRLSTIVKADYIYVFKNGRIVEEGRYSELARKKGEFSKMMQLQALESKG